MTFKREFGYTRENFDQIRKTAAHYSGIALSEDKFDLVYARLIKRLRALEMKDFDEYCDLLNRDPREITPLISALTIHVTHFFRENHHFDYLAKECIPALIHAKAHHKHLRILSAGCSSGEEPYSIAIVLNEVIPDIARWNIKITAIDINPDIIQRASQGNYNKEAQKNLSLQRLHRWFNQLKTDDAEYAQVKPELRRLIDFKVMNLSENHWHLKDSYDIIFCRNVVIYFDLALQRKVFDKFADLLNPHGYLFIGYSEILYRISDRFQNIGRNVYKKIR